MADQDRRAALDGVLRPWPAPAKINLFLRVVGRRADGYHLLQTQFQFLDLADRVWLAVRRDGHIRRLRPLPGVPETADLAWRAAAALKEAAGLSLGVDLAVDKRIPMGGGLGGGSSDAATVLRVLNRLWGLDWPRERLAALGLALGADVPVFVFGRAAWAEGVGERLTARDADERPVLVVAPPVAVSTPALFADPALPRDAPPLDPAAADPEALENAFEPLVRARHPEIAAAFDWFAARGRRARLSGSGGCLFVDYPSAEAAAAERAAFLAGRDGAWRAFVTRRLNRSPLERALERSAPGGRLG
ncbi:MAG: 4-diphosphocytidyl-2-C-methyl-D-erythritol kinase [Gammaproteobacteria bacterium]|nr:MAG: 4-diphosphocytidyl-2-C-methyl-D-erythritol kinase [Gammaproteobacteria bacterium]